MTFSSQQPTQYFLVLWTLAYKELPVQLRLDFSVYSSKAYSVSGNRFHSLLLVSAQVFEDVIFAAGGVACCWHSLRECSVFLSAEILICTHCVPLSITQRE